MNLLLRQIWALIRKNLLLICIRRPIYTFIRALALPLVIILIVAYSKNFFSSPEHWGLSSAHDIRSLKDGLAASPGRDIVGFVDNGMKGGDVSAVIDSLSKQIRDAGKIPKIYESSSDLARDCRTSSSGVSSCYGGVVFHSSPSQSSDESSAGSWNYTLRVAGSSGRVDVRNNNNGPEKDLLPLQYALETEIMRQPSSNSTSLAPREPQVLLFTEQQQRALEANRASTYLTFVIYAFGPIFVFTVLDIVYHMTSFIALERELGMSGLIDTMISGGSNIRGRLIRQISNYLSFAAIYFPGWLAVGIVISVVILPGHSRGLPVGFLILSGLSFTSLALLGSSFFRKAQLSGAIMVVITVVGAILPIVLFEQNKGICAALSIIFPSSNLLYFLTGVAVFEGYDLPVNMSKFPYTEDGRDAHRLPLFVHFIIAILHILLLPVLAFAMEHFLFSTASPHRSFAKPSGPGEPTVVLSGFSKTYHPGNLSRMFKGRKDVHAVQGLDLKAFPGQILCLLGPNGCGKSTTLNCISGDQKVSSGNITIDPTGGLGYAPQRNVLWPELTVKEHIRIFNDLKCLSNTHKEGTLELAKGVDLLKKLNARAKSLSGGQKRKLQMAMMFAGGSAVCCVDEVSTGLDPISRRRIWEILLAERTRRTIIMTTHFLDEADYLADDVAIMYKGTLRAAGTSASLKHTYGDGYTVKLPYHTDVDLQISGTFHKEHSRHQTVYRVSTAALAAELAEQLEKHQLSDYQISGPTMEELFLKVTGDTLLPVGDSASKEESSLSKDEHITVTVAESDYELAEGRPISVLKQWWILLCKRFRILKRRFIPYFVAVAFAIVGAAIAPLLIKKIKEPIPCPTPESLVGDYPWRQNFGSSYYENSYSYYTDREDYELYTRKYVFGPARKLNDSTIGPRLELMVDLYSAEINSGYYVPHGYSNTSQIIEQMILVDTYDEFANALAENYKAIAGRYTTDDDDQSYTTIRGGVWLGDETSKPTVLATVRQVDIISQMLNFLNVLNSGIPISASNSRFATTEIPSLIDFNVLMFIVYYGLIMCCYPVFFALYPTNERISNVRSMQYSNGIRPIPLWLSHLSFDGLFVLVISVVATALLYVSTPLWTGLGYIFIIFFLYGLVAALLSYVISMFAKGAVTAWFLMAFGQVVFYFAYFGGIIGVQSSIPYADMEGMNNALFLGLGIVSPAVCLQRALFIGTQQMALQCNGRAASSIYLFGGPILYLILQGIFLFALLLWWDSGFVIPSRRSRVTSRDAEATDMYSTDLTAERKRLDSPNTDLRLESVTKTFGKNLAVDNVTFGVQQSEIFALLGPNGAGKSTIISMIRGDIKPSSPASSITIAGHSILSHAVTARSTLGVCPQFDSADVLTVKETLRMFAKTRGVKDIDHNVSTVIAACGLEEWTNQLAQKLSGGTKRKLSLAVALVGNPRVLVLDEPSSALDANAKRTLWRCLQTIAKGRAVVLTTHSMEEADALADRIGIVSSRMLALGGREDLKKRAGENFYIHLVSQSAPRTTPEELQRMKDWIYSTFKDAQISRETQGGQVRFEIPVGEYEMVGLIRTLESVKEELGVEFFSVGKATLDEVFENIVRRYGDEEMIER